MSDDRFENLWKLAEDELAAKEAEIAALREALANTAICKKCNLLIQKSMIEMSGGVK